MYYVISLLSSSLFNFFFFFNDTATTEIYTLSLHDALPICSRSAAARTRSAASLARTPCEYFRSASSERVVTCSSGSLARSEEHTSELQSQSNLVCRLLLEKKKKNIKTRVRITLDHVCDTVS